MSANFKATNTEAIIGVGGTDQMTVSNAGVVTANTLVSTLNKSGINQEFSQNNAVIHRLGDKVLIGGATTSDGAFPPVDKDWFGEFQSDKSPIRVVGTISSGATTSGSPIVTFSAGGIVPTVGNYFFGPTIPEYTKVLSIDSTTQITLDKNATASATGLTFFSNSGFLPGTALGQIRSITSTSQASSFGSLFSSQTKYFTSAGTSSIGMASFAINNNSSLATNCWGGYFEAYRLSSTNGGARGIEIDVCSTTSGEINPTAFQQTQTSCLQLGAGNGLGGELPSGVQRNIGASIQIVGNPFKFRSGIVFLANSIEGTDGYTGSGSAIRMATGHGIEWHNPDQDLAARILCTTGITLSQRMELRFTGTGIQFTGTGGVNGYILNGSPTTLSNWWTLQGAAAGSPPILAVNGSDTDVDLRLATKGAGVVRFGTYTNTPLSVAGYITIKDSSGVTRRLAVV